LNWATRLSGREELINSNTIGWWTHSRDLRIASTRIRAELVMRGLRAAGTSASWFEPDHAARFNTLVIGKRHDLQTIQLANAFQQQGGKVIVDLCDNRFEFPPDATELAQQAAQLRQLLNLANHVVASTPTLASIIRSQLPSLPHLSVIGDLADELSVAPTRLRQLIAAKFSGARTLAKLKQLRSSGHTLLVWFGSHGGPYAEAGMSDLLRIRAVLEQAHRAAPLALTVISNSEEKYLQHVKPFAIPTVYTAWNSANFDVLLQAHDISLIPINPNPFTVCKTDNRVVTSLLHGLAVVADEIPSYAPYRASIGLSDWHADLQRYLTDAAGRAQDVATGKALAQELTDKDAIVAQWQAVFAAVQA
jgi:hypothetical protein